MKCQEVMELMQRDLDRDLEESEQESLYAHTQHCPDCAAMFEKLKKLSDDLENLPKVTPPFSIVDSIMPRLEQLEQDHMAVSNRRNRRFAWRTFSGVVAAGIVLALFVFNNEPAGRQKNADMLLGSQTPLSSMAMETKSNESVPDSDDSSAINENFALTNKMSPQATGTYNTADSSEHITKQGAGEQPVAGIMATGGEQGAAGSKGRESERGEMMDMAMNPAEPTSSDQSMNETKNIAPAPDVNSQPDYTGLGLAQMDQELKRGDRVAVVDNQQVAVRDQNGKELYRTMQHWPEDVVIILDAWQSDTTMTFEVFFPDGNTVQYEINLDTGKTIEK